MADSIAINPFMLKDIPGAIHGHWEVIDYEGHSNDRGNNRELIMTKSASIEFLWICGFRYSTPPDAPWMIPESFMITPLVILPGHQSIEIKGNKVTFFHFSLSPNGLTNSWSPAYPSDYGDRIYAHMQIFIPD